MFLHTPPFIQHFYGLIQSQFLTLTASSSISKEIIIGRATKEGILRKWNGTPILISESITDVNVSYVFEFINSEVTSTTNENIKPKKSMPSWILVIPVDEKGNKISWDKTPWTSSWLVPFKRDGIKIVSTVGDSEDREKIGSSDYSTGLNYIRRKYKAPYVALMRNDANSVNILLVGSGEPKGDSTLVGVDNDSNKDSVVSLILRMITNNDGSNNDNNTAGGKTDKIDETGDISPIFNIVSQRLVNSTLEIGLLCDTSDEDEQREARRIIKSINGFTQISSENTENGLLFKGRWNGTASDLESALSASGATIGASH